MRYFVGKIIGAGGLVLAWYGSVIKAGFGDALFAQWPFSGVAFWVAGFALVGLEKSITKNIKGVEEIKNGFVDLVYSVGLSVYFLNMVGIAFLHKMMANLPALTISTWVNAGAIFVVLVGDMLNRGAKPAAAARP